jgi:hypothetical protein
VGCECVLHGECMISSVTSVACGGVWHTSTWRPVGVQGTSMTHTGWEKDIVQYIGMEDVVKNGLFHYYYLGFTYDPICNLKKVSPWD